MAIASGLLTNFAVGSKLFSIKTSNASRHTIRSFPQILEKQRVKIHHFHRGGCNKSVRSVGSNRLEFTYNDDDYKESYWSTKFKDFLRGLRFLLAFLAEQPGQLKYIEWPSFQSTLKTATLTLLIVALLIVALSAVDGGLGYLLVFYIKRNSVK